MAKGEQQLWCAVIEQALADAARPLVSNKLERFEQVRARDWFLGASPYFKRVCSLAGMEWDRLRSIAVQKIEAARSNDAPIRGQTVPLRPRSKRRAKLYENDGLSLTIDQWAVKAGISSASIRVRLKDGMTIAEAIATQRYTRRGVGRNNSPNASDRISPSAQERT
jgi:hypothetical protein